jgi:hypothetical protein
MIHGARRLRSTKCRAYRRAGNLGRGRDPEGEERVSFLQETALPRLAGLCDVLARLGHSWHEVAGEAQATPL